MRHGVKTVKEATALVLAMSRAGVPAFKPQVFGFTVKIHAPQGNAHNTWGGADVGYGIGEK